MNISPLRTTISPTTFAAPWLAAPVEAPTPPVDTTDAVRSTRIGGGIVRPQPVPVDPTV